jgi:hypothetical protein
LERIIDFLEQIKAGLQVISKSIDKSHNANSFLEVLVIIIKVAISKGEEPFFEKSKNRFFILKSFASILDDYENKVEAYLIVTLCVAWEPERVSLVIDDV